MILKRGKKVADYCECKCDLCGMLFTRTLKNIKLSRKKYGEVDYCVSCSCKMSINKKPQCTKEYWQNKDIKIKHGNSIKNSEKYKEGLKNRDTSGEKNSQFGKKRTEEMERKRIKKFKETLKNNPEIQEKRIKKFKETLKNKTKNYEGTLNSLIRRYINNEINWYRRSLERDNYLCRFCESDRKLDVHHIKPLQHIIKQKLLENPNLKTKEEQYNFLILQDEIIDINLKNALTLCRDCHKHLHRNWGSHDPFVINEDESVV